MKTIFMKIYVQKLSTDKLGTNYSTLCLYIIYILYAQLKYKAYKVTICDIIISTAFELNTQFEV
jgi:uncharacterized membrane protein YkgB